MATLETIVTFLEMKTPGDLGGNDTLPPSVMITKVLNCTVSFYRYLYGEVGREYHWVERRRWSDEQLSAYLADPGVLIWLLQVDGCPAGYYELCRDGDGGVQIAYFGLVPDFVGQGLGKLLLSAAVKSGWALDPRPARVWLHTCTLDHPQALPNYMARGFVPYKTETELIETLD